MIGFYKVYQGAVKGSSQLKSIAIIILVSGIILDFKDQVIEQES